MEKKTKLATIAAMLGNSIFGFSFMFSRIALSVTTPFVMLMYRFMLAALGLALLVLIVRLSGRGRSTDDSLRFSLRGKPILPLVCMGLVQPVLYFLCESYGISLTNSAFSGVIIALEPIAALVLGALALREIPARAQVLFSLLSVAGVVLMTLQQSAEGEIHLLGVVLLFGAVLSGAAFNIISRSISEQFSALERTFVMMLIAAVVFTALAVAENRADLSALLAPLASPGFLAALMYLALASSIGAFLLLNYANNYLLVAKTTAFCNLTTVISLFAGVVFLHEPFAPVSLLASGMIILGIWGVQRGQ